MKKLVVILAVAWLAAGIGAAYLWRQLDELRSQNVSVQARVQALEMLAQSQVSFTPQAQGADAATATAAAPAAAAPLPVAGEVATNTAASEMNRTMLRRVLIQQYPDLEQELDLSADELEKFLDLLASQRMNPSAGGQEAVAALLGNRYSQWQDYQQTLPARQQVNQLRGQLAASGSALSAAQARPLMAALDAEQKRIDQDSLKNRLPRSANEQEMMDRDMQRAVDSNRRLVEAAAPHLNAQQLDSYRRMLDQQIEFGRTMLQSLKAVQGQSGNP